ncbi:hypothetical protein PCYB_005410 [Plasmodium cynomolgi strain B]|uniref:Schizont-infected cell agglutination C-terminal domain-containing protein n=1 Tax=Plasmodium cynomolgi (strain B) TaxID=1120755 RepID=K6VK27_PLACD|nr:hypothetical protein PCYB_005410 [Plasmodium cynomolgi strain B]GAB69792.1 hypothetical protein PCYB_005410 [Plasmodium cynomolgi strain B]
MDGTVEKRKESISNNPDETHNEENGCIDDAGPAGATLQAGKDTATQASTTIPQSDGAGVTLLAKASRETELNPKQTKDNIDDGLLFKEAGLDILIPYIPIIPILISIFIPSFLIWKFLYPILFDKRRRYRRMHQMSDPPLEENIFEHIEQAADLPPVSYGYTMIKKGHPRFSTRRTKKGVKRTIIDIHLEVLNECQNGDSDLAKGEFLEILVNEFMGEIMQPEQELTEEENMGRNSLDIPSCDHISNQERTKNLDLGMMILRRIT